MIGSICTDDFGHSDFSTSEILLPTIYTDNQTRGKVSFLSVQERKAGDLLFSISISGLVFVYSSTHVQTNRRR